VKLGYRKISQIRRALENNELDLTANARIGVQFYEQFQEKMNRNEARSIGKIVEEACKKYFPDAEITIMGSYRRGKLQCGDVDVLITHRKYTKTTPLGALDELVERLKRTGHISHHLTNVNSEHFKTMPSQDDDFHDSIFAPYPSSQMYMGVFVSPLIRGKHRRIDIKFYPFKERIFASLYFTGNGYFNRSMRLFAQRRKNMHLNDSGLFNVIGPGRKGNSIKANTEKDVFDYLGLIYREPSERDGFDAVREKDSAKDSNGTIFLETPNQGEIRSEARHVWID